MATCMAMGEAAGTAAALSVQQKIDPKDLDTKLLTDTLLKNGAILRTGKKWSY
jgi:hypothetical protein